MPPRSQLPPKDRAARARLMQLLGRRRPLLKGGLVEMARRCGKPGCKCLRGEKHRSLYLAARVGKERKMIYVPPDLEQAVRQWLADGRRGEALVEEMVQASLATLAQRKRAARAKPLAKGSQPPAPPKRNGPLAPNPHPRPHNPPPHQKALGLPPNTATVEEGGTREASPPVPNSAKCTVSKIR
jgi:hypothetical protein